MMVKRRLNYWKPLSLPILAKARVIEIFHASKLWYAGSFYPIPEALLREVDDAFVDYIIFPKRRIEVSRMEMEKERLYGGIKLINTRLKSLTPKVHWLVNLTVDENLRSHLYIFECLVGEQRMLSLRIGLMFLTVWTSRVNSIVRPLMGCRG